MNPTISVNWLYV